MKTQRGLYMRLCVVLSLALLQLCSALDPIYYAVKVLPPSRKLLLSPQLLPICSTRSSFPAFPYGTSLGHCNSHRRTQTNHQYHMAFGAMHPLLPLCWIHSLQACMLLSFTSFLSSFSPQHPYLIHLTIHFVLRYMTRIP